MRLLAFVVALLGSFAVAFLLLNAGGYAYAGDRWSGEFTITCVAIVLVSVCHLGLAFAIGTTRAQIAAGIVLALYSLALFSLALFLQSARARGAPIAMVTGILAAIALNVVVHGWVARMARWKKH